jgi:drug/metabolite transporter (DMT)-like permease
VAVSRLPAETGSDSHDQRGSEDQWAPVRVVGRVRVAAVASVRVAGPVRVRAILFVLGLGATFPLQQVGLRYWPPILLVGSRCLIAGIAMFVVTWEPLRRVKVERAVWRQVVITACIASTLNVILLSLGAVYAVDLTSGGLASLLIYTQPLFFALLASALLKDKLTPYQFLFVIVGFVGVGLVTIPMGVTGWSIWGVVAGIGGGLSWALGSVYLRSVTRGSPERVVANVQRSLISLTGGLQFIFGGLVLLSVGSILESWSQVHLTTQAMGALLAFSACGAIGWLAYFSLLNRPLAARRLGAWSFAVPLIANAAGILFLGETFDSLFIAGAILVSISILGVEAWTTR